MKYCQYNNALWFVQIKQRIGKTAESNAADATIYLGIALGVLCGKLNRTIDFQDELRTRSRTVFLIPQRRVVKLCATQHAERQPGPSRFKAFSDRSLDVEPRHNVARVCFLLGDTPIKFCSLRVGERKLTAFRGDAVP